MGAQCGSVKRLLLPPSLLHLAKCECKRSVRCQLLRRTPAYMLPASSQRQQAGSSQAQWKGQHFTDEFMMFTFKVEMCKRLDKHSKELCPYAHPGELARRRHPSMYQALPCPEVKAKKICPRLENCNCSHNTFEFWLHPDRYKTSFCERGASCERPICFFAHSQDELRPLPQGLNRAESASRSISKHTDEVSSSRTLQSSQQQQMLSGDVVSAQTAADLAQVTPVTNRTRPSSVEVREPAPFMQSSQQGAVQGLAAGGSSALPDVSQTTQGVVLVNVPPQQQYMSHTSAPGARQASTSQQVIVGYHPIQNQGGLQGVVMVRPPSQQGATVAVIPAGPSTWASAQGGTSQHDRDPPTLEVLCAALSQVAVQPAGLGVGLQAQLQQVQPYSNQQQQQLAMMQQQQQLQHSTHLLQQQQLQDSSHLLHQQQYMPMYMTATPPAQAHQQQQVVQPLQLVGGQQLVVVSNPLQGTADAVSMNWGGAAYGI